MQDQESKIQARLRESREATLSGKEFAPDKPASSADDGPKMVCRRDLWSHPESDVLAILKALGAYEFSGCKDSFAISHGEDFTQMVPNCPIPTIGCGFQKS